MSILPTQGPPSILSAQRTGPTSTEGLLSAQENPPDTGPPPILSAQNNFRHRGLLSAQGPPLGGTGASSRRYGPLSGTRASSPHRGLPQSHQHRGVGPFGTVSLLPTQGPPSILSAQTTGPTSIEGLLSAQGPHPDTGPPPKLSAQNIFRHRGSPLGTGVSSRRHRGLLSTAQGLFSAALGPPLGTVSLLPTQGPP